MDQSKSENVAAGSTVLCVHCGTPVPLLRRKKPPTQFTSKALQAFLSWSQETNPARYALFDAARVRRFETYLAEHDLTLQEVQMGHVKSFLQWISGTEGPELANGFEITLVEFFKALQQKKILTVNPMAKRRMATEPVDMALFSDALIAFVEHQKPVGAQENLAFDIRRLLVWEAFLARRQKNASFAQEKDFIDFMDEIDKKQTPVQACGFAVSIQDFYAVLVRLGFMEPVLQPAGFLQRRETADLILHSQEAGLAIQPDMRQLRLDIKRTRDWQVVFFVTIFVIVGFGGFLGYQLLSHNARQVGEPEALPSKSANALKDAQVEARKKEERERQEKERQEKEKQEREKQEKEKQEKARQEREKQEKVRQEQEKLEQEKKEKEKLEKERQEQEKLEQEKKEQEKKEQEKKEQEKKQAKKVPQVKNCIEGDCLNGVGTYLNSDGTRYIGHWQNGKMHGVGEFRFSSGRGYRGEWKNGRLVVIFNQLDNTKP